MAVLDSFRKPNMLIPSLQAQNNWGKTLDTSQSEPVIVTRYNRPYSIVLKASGTPRDIYKQYLVAMSTLFPLRKEEAQNEMNRVFESIGDQAEKDGLSEEDVARLVHESRQ